MISTILESGRRELHTIISREIIKPSSPTPSHLQIYNLSQVDQCMMKEPYQPLIFLYPNKEINTSFSLTCDEKAQVMKKALGKSLTRWYPLAGRLHTRTTPPYINCNDEGVIFVEAKHDTHLDKFQHMSEIDESVSQLFVDGIVWLNSAENSIILGVQLNHFACGGLAVAVSMSHAFGDAISFVSFINYWASVTCYGSTDHEEIRPLNPLFIQSPTEPIFVQPEDNSSLKQRCSNRVTRKFVFPNSKLSDLKNKVLALAEGTGSTLAINNPTRFEVLTSLLYKTLTTPRSSSFKRSYLLSVMDVRKKLIPQLPQNTVGNVIACFLVATRDTSETSLSLLVSEIRKQKMELERVQSLQLAYESFERLGSEDIENVTSRAFWFSSLCGIPFYKADFGWGKPTAAIATFGFSNCIGSVLMDTPDGDGIEAWVTLETQDMEIFQNDKEMLLFCKK